MSKETGVTEADIGASTTLAQTHTDEWPQQLADHRVYGYDTGYYDGRQALVDEIFADILHALAINVDIDAVNFRRMALTLYDLKNEKKA